MNQFSLKIKFVVITDLYVILLCVKIAADGLMPLKFVFVYGLFLESKFIPTYAEIAGIRFFHLNFLSAK